MVEFPEKPVSIEELRDEKWTMKKVIGLVWIFLGLQLVVSGIFGVVGGLLGGAAGFDRGNIIALTLAVVTGISGTLTALYGSSQLQISLQKEFREGSASALWLFKGVTLCYAAVFVFNIGANILDMLLEQFGLSLTIPMVGAAGSFWENFFNFLAVVCLAPLLEEFVFRGLICRSLARYHKGFAVVFSALLFAMMHLNFGQGIPVFGMGLALGFVYLRSNSLLVPWFAHLVNNLVAYGAGFLDSPVVINVVIVIVSLVGVFWIVKERREIGWMFDDAFTALEPWRLASRSIGFWAFAAIFLIISVLEIFMPWLLG